MELKALIFYVKLSLYRRGKNAKAVSSKDESARNQKLNALACSKEPAYDCRATQPTAVIPDKGYKYF